MAHTELSARWVIRGCAPTRSRRSANPFHPCCNFPGRRALNSTGSCLLELPTHSPPAVDQHHVDTSIRSSQSRRDPRRTSPHHHNISHLRRAIHRRTPRRLRLVQGSALRVIGGGLRGLVEGEVLLPGGSNPLRRLVGAGLPLAGDGVLRFLWLRVSGGCRMLRLLLRGGVLRRGGSWVRRVGWLVRSRGLRPGGSWVDRVQWLVRGGGLGVWGGGVGEDGAGLGGYCVAFVDGALAGSRVGGAVDNDQAVVARADGAEHASGARGTAGGAPRGAALSEEDRGDGLAGSGGDRFAVDGDLYGGRRTDLGRVVRVRTEVGGHAATTAGRSTRKGTGSTWGVRPRKSSVISRPVEGARPMPAPSWPVACQRPSRRGSGPITGR